MENILNMTRKEQVSYWVGQLCVAIGQGKFNDTVALMIDYYQREAFERGVRAGKAEMGSMF